jgi:hypothetical protein
MINDDGHFHDVWYSNSGSSQHVCGDKGWFTQFTTIEHPKAVYLPDRRATYAIGIGKVSLMALMDGRWVPSTLSNVLHIPGAANLFSEPVMANKGYIIVRTATKTDYTADDGSPGAEAYQTNNMYVLSFRRMEQASFAASVKSRLAQWHNRCAPINVQYLRKPGRKPRKGWTLGKATKGLSVHNAKRESKQASLTLPFLNEQQSQGR